MNNLDIIRQSIDNIDEQIVKLYEKRLELVQEVADFKKLHNINVLQSDREAIVLQKSIDNLHDKKYSHQVKKLMTAIMDISKDMQRDKNFSYQNFDFQREEIDLNAKKGFFGQIGSNSERAMISMLGSKNAYSYDSFESVFLAVNSDEIKYGVVPIENSSTGAINEIYDLLGKYNFYIIAEKWEKINHQLFGVKGSNINDIKAVYSHVQAIKQCDEFLGSKNWELRPYYSTAMAAKMVAEKNDKSLSAIASDYTGIMYGLEKLTSDIHTNKENFTRFIVISKKLSSTNNNKISVLFNLVNKPGALFNILKFFAKYDINMSKIESRPVRNNPCNYYFYVDLEGNCFSHNISIALDYVKQNSNVFKFLGEYKKDEIL